MKDIHEQTYYELLEIEPSASQEEILKAYNKARTTYGSNSPALYSLLNKEEAQELLRLIDEAYSVLSNQFKRKQYDKAGNVITPEAPAAQFAGPGKAKSDGDDGDFAIPQVSDMGSFAAINSSPGGASQRASGQSQSSSGHSDINMGLGTTRFGKYKIDEEFENEIKVTEDFSGASIQKIRVYKNITLDQISEVTKISRPYLTALEKNDYPCLPAHVFVRGFLVQVAKALQIDQEKVANSYIRLMKDGQKK